MCDFYKFKKIAGKVKFNHLLPPQNNISVIHGHVFALYNIDKYINSL